MLKSRVIIELTPVALDGAVIRRGSVIRSAHVEIDAQKWRQAWEEGLSPFDAPLTELLTALGVSGETVDVAYRSPSSFAEIITVPATGAGAISAARLALADHLGYPPAANPHSVHPVATGKAGGATVTHTLSIADRSEVSDTIETWLRRAGCRLSAAIPTSAAALLDAVENHARSHDAVSVTASVDRHYTLLTVASADSLRLIRRIEIGFEDIVAPLTRPIDRAGGSGEAVRFTPSQARRIALTHGVPDFATTIDEISGLTGKDVLPLIQPALQRLVIEIKQSLRFELSDEERDGVSVTFSGPFGALPNLARTVCDQLEASRQETPGTDAVAQPDRPFLGDDRRALRLSKLARSRPILSPRINAEQRVASVHRGLRAGAVAAVLALGATLYLTHQQMKAQTAATARLGGAVELVDEIFATQEALQQRGAGLRSVLARVDGAIGETALWSPTLAAMPGLIPEGVELTALDGRAAVAGRSPSLSLTGISRSSGNGTEGAALNTFIEQLKASLVVADVHLGDTSRIQGDGDGEALRFSLEVSLVAVPRLALAEAGTGVTP